MTFCFTHKDSSACRVILFNTAVLNLLFPITTAFHGNAKIFMEKKLKRDFKLSLCSEFCMLSSG